MRKVIHIFISMVLVGCWLLIGVDRGSTQTLPSEPWVMPFDIPAPTSNVTQKDIYEFMWQTFIALNWPHKTGGSRGEPDTEKTLAPWSDGLTSDGPVVWETYRRPDQVFLPPSEWPITWNEELPQNVCFPGSGSKIKVLNVNETDYSEFADGINQPFTQANYPTGPVLDQNKNYLRYEVTMNQSYFSYISFFQYYRAETQKRAVRNYINFTERTGEPPPPLKTWQSGRSARFFQPLPNGKEAYLTRVFKLPPYALQGIVEIKATWKVLGEGDVPGRFYRREVFFLNPDGECTGPHVIGLLGYHIHRVIPFGTVRDFEHIGTTFEQVDNVSLPPDEEGGPFPLPPHPSLNPGIDSDSPPPYLNGYQVNGQSGRSGLIPPPLQDGEPLPEKSERPITNISRQVPVSPDVKEVNAKFRGLLRERQSVWFYYKMIGTSNPNLNNPPNPPNPYLGPGIAGAQYSNGQNLINTALESYTQEGWACQRCHLNAFPQGVSFPLPSFEEKFKALHIISFLLLNAKSEPRRSKEEESPFPWLKHFWEKKHHKK